jgi:hypothetical protein
MLPALSLALFQLDPAKIFIAECAKAVLSIRQGVWGMENGDTSSPARTIVLIKGETRRVQYISDGQTMAEAVLGPTSSLILYRSERKFLRQNYPQKPAGSKPEPLRKLEVGEVEYKLTNDRGLVLRAKSSRRKVARLTVPKRR